MKEKWVVAHEYDLEKGLCFLARRDSGKGPVAFFPSREAAEEWATSGEDLDPDLWEFIYIKLTEDD